MTSRISQSVFMVLLALVLLSGCSNKEAVAPEPDPQQVRIENQMKALANEMLKLKESQAEVEDLRATIAAMDSQMVRYEVQLAAKDKELARTQPKISPTDPDIINLRGNIYVLSREIDSLKQGMKTLQARKDSLEQKLEPAPTGTEAEPAVSTMTIKMQAEVPATEEPAPAPKAIVQPAPTVKPEPEQSKVSPGPDKPVGFKLLADYRKAYNHALNLYLQKDFHGSIESFRILIEREPEGAYADNSQYWIGECYYSLEDYPNAIKEFQKVFQFPENNKSDHALFKIALSYSKLGDTQRARSNMNRFILDFPNSELIEQAHQFLSSN